MNKKQKAEMVSEIKELIENASALYVTDYKGIDVADISNIRNQFRNEGVKYKVFKNTLFNIALKETGKFEKLAENLTGMTGFAFTSENPVAPAKIIKKYNDETSKLALKACYIEDQYYDGSSLATLATLPSKPEIISSILGSLNSPAQGIVGAINAVMRDLVSVIDEISKKQAA